jgi:hypothetical protein
VSLVYRSADVSPHAGLDRTPERQPAPPHSPNYSEILQIVNINLSHNDNFLLLRLFFYWQHSKTRRASGDGAHV